MRISLRQYQYTLPNGRKVFLTNRPDSVQELDSIERFLQQHTPGVRFMFTDDLVVPPAGGPPWHWFPWVPCKNPPLENIFAFICQMDHFDRTTPTRQAAWLHCDSSTMRAPTYFGMYLHALFPGQVETIQSTVQINEGSYDHVSDITQYSAVEFKRQPKSLELIQAWNRGGVKAAYEVYMRVERPTIGQKIVQIGKLTWQLWRHDIPLALRMLGWTMKWRVRRHYTGLYRGLHKLLGTEQGQYYKKHGR